MTTLFTVTLNLTDEKKHSVRYDAIPAMGANPGITAIYVGKNKLPKPFPATIVVLVSAGPVLGEQT